MRLTVVLLLFIYSINLHAQIPIGYYNTASGLSGSALKSALHNIIDDHTEISYSNAKLALMVLDEDPGNSNNIKLIYKGNSIAKADFDAGVDGWNREHIWPQSHGDFGTSMGVGTDLHALRPADVSVNTSRSNKDFGEGTTQHSEATDCYYTADLWEPPDNVKGDIARSVFYIATRYEGDIFGEPDLIVSETTTSTSTGLGYLGTKATLLQWHIIDPVDATEQARNNAIYSSYQTNRNPFIDHPEYVDLIWGAGLPVEPSNHVSNFSAHTITLNWSDATGTILPDAYLVRMSEVDFGSIATPTDGSEVADNFWNKNISYGIETCIFSGLTAGSTYYFKIFPYTGNGNGTDFKTNDTPLQISLIAK